MIEIVTDYASPLIRIEKLVKEIHDRCLAREYAAAQLLCTELVTETRVLKASITVMAEKEPKNGN